MVAKFFRFFVKKFLPSQARQIIQSDKGWVVKYKIAWTGRTAIKDFLTEEDAIAWLKAKEAEKKYYGKRSKPTQEDINVHALMQMYFKSALKNAVTIHTYSHHIIPVIEAFGQRKVKSIALQDQGNLICRFGIDNGLKEVVVEGCA